MIVNAAQNKKTVATPNASYESMKPLWDKSKAVCSGERFVKDYDSYLDRLAYRNLLLPFSPTMTDAQYNFYKSEAELPGFVSQFAKTIVGALLRKKPVLTLPEKITEEVKDWIMNSFGQDGSTLAAFLDEALWEEMKTSRSWIYVDYPSIKDPELLSREELLEYKPYPILWKSDEVINWRTRQTDTGKNILDRVIIKGSTEVFEEDNEFHPTYIDTVWVHELDDAGYYQIRVFKANKTVSVPVVNGKKQVSNANLSGLYELDDTITSFMFNGERLNFIPAWPLNGSIEPIEPILTPLVDKEVALYNKMSRRNHLLYGASTYTPVISSDMGDEEFQAIIESGLGTWLKLRQGDTASVLETPTAALQDMEKAIASAIEEMARMGIRMLSPETEQSGIALEIRNAAQTAQLGTLNNKVSNTLSQVIAFMINWRYDLDLSSHETLFSLSADFNPTPLGADWLRLTTEWYQQGMIPRSIWLNILKQNDILDPEYNDEEGLKEINSDEILITKKEDEMKYAKNLKDEE